MQTSVSYYYWHGLCKLLKLKDTKPDGQVQFSYTAYQKQGCESEKKGKKQTLPENIGDKQIVVRVMVTQTEA